MSLASHRGRATGESWRSSGIPGLDDLPGTWGHVACLCGKDTNVDLMDDFFPSGRGGDGGGQARWKVKIMTGERRRTRANQSKHLHGLMAQLPINHFEFICAVSCVNAFQ